LCQGYGRAEEGTAQDSKTRVTSQHMAFLFWQRLRASYSKDTGCDAQAV